MSELMYEQVVLVETNPR